MDERPEEIAEDAHVSPAGEEDGETPTDPQQPEPYRPAGPELEAEEARIVEEQEPRQRPRWRLPALIIAVLAIAAGAFVLLGGSGEEVEGPAEPAGKSELRVVLDPDGEGPARPREVSLRCPGGKPAACKALRKLPRKALRPIPRKRVCATIYGGPDRVVIRGRIGRRQVAIDLMRTNSCELERFDEWMGVIEALFPRYRPGAALS